MSSFWARPRAWARHASSAFNITFDFSSVLPAGVTIASAEASSIDATSKADTTATVFSSGAGATIEDDNLAKVWVDGGAAGSAHILLCTATGSDGGSYVLASKMYVENEQ